ncbi:hypothetical protein Tco_1071276 [Tanacetum coccineum]
MTTLKFADTHNMVAFLAKPAESKGFEQIVDILNAHTIKYALTINPKIYTSCIEQFWATIKAKTVNEEVQLQALVDGKKIIITESIVRRDLQLKDAEGVDCLPNATTFEQLTLMGYEKVSQKLTFYKAFFPTMEIPYSYYSTMPNLKNTAWNEFSSTMASSIIYLAKNQKFNFSKLIFESIMKNSDNVSGKFLMYPRAAHNASMIEAELSRDSGNIIKTRSKETLNEPSSPRTSSGSGPRRQDTMGGIIAQTRFENVSKTSNDSLLAGVNTPRSDEDSMKLKELMEFCTKLQQRGRYGDDLMFDTSDLAGEEVFVVEQGVPDSKKDDVVSTAGVATTVSAAATTVLLTLEEITLAQALEELKTPKPKKKELIRLDEEIALKLQAEFDEEAKIKADHELAQRLQAQEQEELSDAEKATLFVQLLEKRRKHFAAKRLEEKRNKPQTQAQQRKNHKMFDRAFKRVNTFVDSRTDLVKGSYKRAGEELEQESAKK